MTCFHMVNGEVLHYITIIPYCRIVNIITTVLVDIIKRGGVALQAVGNGAGERFTTPFNMCLERTRAA